MAQTAIKTSNGLDQLPPRNGIYEVTPTTAAAWLELSAGNRTIKKTFVARYARAMAEGEWRVTSESIGFAEGRLQNGHHRLLACVESKVNFRTRVTIDNAPEAFSVTDTGRTRTHGDVLGAEVDLDSWALRSLSAALRFVWRYDKRGPAPSQDELLRFFLDGNQGAADWSRKISAQLRELGSRSLVAPSALVFLAHVAQREGAEIDLLDQFIDGCVTGESLPGDSPILRIRRQLERSRSRSGHSHYGPWSVCHLVGRAWQDYSAGKSVGKGHYRTTGQFPVIRG